MSLATGAYVPQHQWTDLPMPKEVIQQVNEIRQEQGMPTTFTCAD